MTDTPARRDFTDIDQALDTMIAKQTTALLTADMEGGIDAATPASTTSTPQTSRSSPTPPCSASPVTKQRRNCSPTCSNRPADAAPRPRHPR